MPADVAPEVERQVGRLGESIASLSGANALPSIAAVVTAPVLSHSLGVVSRGEVAAASAPYLLATAVATFGIPEAITYFVARASMSAPAALRRGLLMAVVSGALVTAGVVWASGWLSDGDEGVQRLIILGGLSIVPSLVLGVVRGVAGGLQRWPLVVRERAVTTGTRLFLVVGLAVIGQLTTTTATVTIVLTPLLGLLAYIPLRHHLGASSDVSPRSRVVMSYGLRIWMGSISGVLLLRVDQAVMNPLAGPKALGLYTVAATVSEIPLITTAAMRDVTFVADAADAADERLATTSRVSGLLALAIGLVVGCSLPLWIGVVFGSDFRPALPVAWVLLVAVVLGAPGSIIGAGLSARGRPDLRSIALVVACVINLMLIFALVPSHGAMGAALATLFGNAAAGVLAALFLRRSFGLAVKPFYGLHRGDLALILGVSRRVVRSRLRRPGRRSEKSG